MANGLFISAFRGPGSPGAPGVGSTRAGLAAAGQAETTAETSRIGLQGTRDTARLQSLFQGALQLKQIQDPQRKLQFLLQRKEQLKQSGVPSNDTDESIALAQQGRFEELNQLTDQAISIGQQLRRKGGASARAFAPETIRKVIGQDEKGEDIFGLFSRQMIFDPNTKTSRATETRIEGDLVTSTGETITQQRLGKIELKKREEEAKAVGKALGEASTAPLVAETRSTIETAVKLASAAAAARGETLTDLARSEAALPGLRNAVAQLRELAPIVTSTIAGKIFDVSAKELGFGSTKGANARAKFIAIINNQVLPLLKPTFGGSFTVTEGDELKATLGDPDATPTQKMEQLDAFIDQKVRDIQAKQTELGGEVTSTEELTTGATPAPAAALQPELPEGAIIRNPQTGQRQQVVNGQLVNI